MNVIHLLLYDIMARNYFMIGSSINYGYCCFFFKVESNYEFLKTESIPSGKIVPTKLHICSEFEDSNQIAKFKKYTAVYCEIVQSGIEAP